MAEEPVDEEDLRTLVREFRGSVAAELAATNRRFTEQVMELRGRLTGVEGLVRQVLQRLEG